ncbi:MAG: DUF371 domain-containing protein [Candidatus Bathyarchaeota archaeon]|nr:DUF371 domain-containing protein [Candidatus Termiticorpusculum sp.]MCL2868353.1 DUF371 domain-containing protein [Candidatus Termiticorpusculum sp.]
MTKQLKEQITAFGHPNILATHPTTLMITKDKELTKKGDCIIAINANKTIPDLNPEFKQKLQNPNTKLTITIETDNLIEQITAYGATELELNNNNDMVIRKSNFTSNRTLAIKANKAAKDLPRELIKKLENPNQQIKITLTLT